MNKKYAEIAKIADSHIEKLKANNDAINEDTIAGLMFISTHSNYLKTNVRSHKVRKRHNAAMIVITKHLTKYDHKQLSYALSRAGILTHNQINLFFWLLFFGSIYALYHFCYDMLSIDNFISLIIVISFGTFIIGSIYCSSTLPSFITRKLK